MSHSQEQAIHYKDFMMEGMMMELYMIHYIFLKMPAERISAKHKAIANGETLPQQKQTCQNVQANNFFFYF